MVSGDYVCCEAGCRQFGHAQRRLALAERQASADVDAEAASWASQRRHRRANPTSTPRRARSR